MNRMNSLILLILGVCVCAVVGSEIKVCQEDDMDLRVDCQIEPKSNQINDYTFSISKDTKETLLNTNVSGVRPDLSIMAKTQVEELEPHGFRMILKDFEISKNTTFMCKVSKKFASMVIEKDELVACSAVSVFLHSCPVLLFLFSLFNSWSLSSI